MAFTEWRVGEVAFSHGAACDAVEHDAVVGAQGGRCGRRATTLRIFGRAVFPSVFNLIANIGVFIPFSHEWFPKVAL